MIGGREMFEGEKGREPPYDPFEEVTRLRKVIRLARDDLTLIVAKHAIGKDRTVRRMAKYLNTECRK